MTFIAKPEIGRGLASSALIESRLHTKGGILHVMELAGNLEDSGLAQREYFLENSSADCISPL